MRGKERNSAFFNQQKVKPSVSLQSRFKAARAQGTLNMSSCVPPMTSIPMEVFDLEKFIEEGEKFWEFEPLKSLDLSFNKICCIPDEVCNLIDCTSMKFRDNCIENIPDTLYEGCISLKHLDIGSNKLTCLSGRIANLCFLKDLLLSNNQLTDVPSELMDCQSMVTLELDHNKLRSLPDHRWQLNMLVSLNVSHNSLQCLPSSLGNITTLEIINCGSNCISQLPDFSRLTSLRILDASQNALVEFPSLPKESSRNKLSHLILGYNRISFIDIGVLLNHRNLSELLLHNNQLQEVPAEIEHISSLKIIDVSNNNLRDIPATLGYMPSLQHIRAEGNPIKVIRQHVIVKGGNELKAHLRSRGPSLVEAAPIDDTAQYAAAAKMATSPGIPPTSNRDDDYGDSFAGGRGVGSSVSSGGGVGRGGARIPNSATVAAAQSQLHDRIHYRIRDITGTTLDLSALSLSALPPDFVEQVLSVPLGPTVATINLASNSFSTIPAEILDIPSLRAINFTGNKLGAGAGAGQEIMSLANMPHISSIDISKNDISCDLLRQMVTGSCDPRLCNLTEVVANNNPLRSIPGELVWHRGLRTVRLSYCLLTSLDEIDFTAIPSLLNLDVSNNKIARLPASIFGANSLEYLSVENNELKEIPIELGALSALKVLLIAGNPQRTVRTNILQQGSSKTIEWLRSRLPAAPEHPSQTSQTSHQLYEQSGWDTPSPPYQDNANVRCAATNSTSVRSSSTTSTAAFPSHTSRRRVPSTGTPHASQPYADEPPPPVTSARQDYASLRADMQYSTENSAYREHTRQEAQLASQRPAASACLSNAPLTRYPQPSASVQQYNNSNRNSTASALATSDYAFQPPPGQHRGPYRRTGGSGGFDGSSMSSILSQQPQTGGRGEEGRRDAISAVASKDGLYQSNLRRGNQPHC